MTMKFDWMGRTVKLHGDPSLTKMFASLNAMLKTIREGGQGYWVEFGSIMIEEMGQTEAVRHDLEMLDEFSSLFEYRTRLSHRRSHH